MKNTLTITAIAVLGLATLTVLAVVKLRDLYLWLNTSDWALEKTDVIESLYWEDGTEIETDREQFNARYTRYNMQEYGMSQYVESNYVVQNGQTIFISDLTKALDSLK